MARSLSEPPTLPKATVHPVKSGVSIQVEYKNGRMVHRETYGEAAGEYPIRYAVGSGQVGQSFLAEVGGHLVQSPLSYYSKTKKWDLTPGYEGSRIPAFTQSVTRDCLFCHAGGVQSVADDRFVPDSMVAIGCERCHGPSEQHRQNPSARNIVNPAKLAVRERDSVCEQCHLKGAAAVLQPGKQWSDFEAGQKLETVAMHYVEAAPRGSIVAVSHAEQLSLSQCVRASAGKLWCGSCHDPHGAPGADRKAEIRAVCSGCHQPATLTALHVNPGTADCVGCHMPRSPASDVAHAAVTDHRIVRRAGESLAGGNGNPGALVPWKTDTTPAKPRNEALAWFAYSQKTKDSGVSKEALKRLELLPAMWHDAAVQAAAGYLLLEFGRPKLAIPDFISATRDEPGNKDFWLDLAISQDAAGATTAALASLERAIAADAFDYRPYLAAAKIYSRLGAPDQARRVIQRYLRLDPQNLTMRLAD